MTCINDLFFNKIYVVYTAVDAAKKSTFLSSALVHANIAAAIATMGTAKTASLPMSGAGIKWAEGDSLDLADGTNLFRNFTGTFEMSDADAAMWDDYVTAILTSCPTVCIVCVDDSYGAYGGIFCLWDVKGGAYPQAVANEPYKTDIKLSRKTGDINSYFTFQACTS